MLDRRQFLTVAGKAGAVFVVSSLPGCGREASSIFRERKKLWLYDTYAMALYFDGSLGPQTGIVLAKEVVKGAPLHFEFWHGHGGVNHQFTLTEEHLKQLRNLKKITVETNEVEGHSHRLFIDPNDRRWRVPGSEPIEVPEER